MLIEAYKICMNSHCSAIISPDYIKNARFDSGTSYLRARWKWNPSGYGNNCSPQSQIFRSY